jgi:hypothetical protein
MFGPHPKPEENDPVATRPFSLAASDDLLEEIFKQHQEQKAVKSDNAQVPEYSWESHLIEVGGT